MTQGAAARKRAPLTTMPISCRNPAFVTEKYPCGKRVRTRPKTGTSPPCGQERVRQAREGVPPEAECHVEAQGRPGHLDGEVADGPPADAVASDRLQPAQEPGAADEGLRVVDLHAQHGPGQGPAPVAHATGAADGQGENGQAEECDGQDQARRHGEAHEGETDDSETSAHEVEAEFAPRSPREGLPQDPTGQSPGRGHLLLAHGKCQLPAAQADAHLAVLGLLYGHRSARPPARASHRWCRSSRSGRGHGPSTELSLRGSRSSGSGSFGVGAGSSGDRGCPPLHHVAQAAPWEGGQRASRTGASPRGADALWAIRLNPRTPGTRATPDTTGRRRAERRSWSPIRVPRTWAPARWAPRRRGNGRPP